MTRPAGANSTPHHPTPRPPFQGGARAGQPQARASQRKPGTPYSPPLPPTNKLPPPFPRRTCPCQPHGAAWLRAKKKAGQDAVKRSKGGKGGKKGGGGRGESRSWLTPLTTNSVSPTHPRRVRNRPAHATPTAAGRGGGRGGGTPAPAGESVKAPQRHGGSEGAERKESTPTSTWQSPPHPPTTTASDGVCCGEWERGAVGPALSQQRGGGARSRQHANGWPRTSGEFSRPTPPPLFATERRQCRFWRAWPASPLATRSKYGQPPSRMWVWGGGGGSPTPPRAQSQRQMARVPF